MKCPVCKNENPAGAKFCMKCGARFSQACPKCGAGNLAEAVYCEQCGARLAPAETRRTARRRTPYVAAFIGALLAIAAIAVVVLFVGPALDLWPSVWATPATVQPTPEPHAQADDELAPDSGENIEAPPAEPLQDEEPVPAGIESRGEWIAYQTEDSDGTVSLWVVRPDGENPVELVSEVEAVEYTLVEKAEWQYKRTPFAPKGSHMLFKVQDSGRYSLHTYALGEGEAEGIVSDAKELEYRFSPDGNRIAVEMQDEDGKRSLLVMDVAGESQVSLLSGVNSVSWDWMPNGRQLIVMALDTLHVTDVDGEEQVTIAEELYYDVQFMVFSDGDWIAYAVTEDNYWDIYVTAADGSDSTRLDSGGSALGGAVMLLDFSPDKLLRVAVSFDAWGRHHHLSVLEADGTDEVTLARDANYARFCPGAKRIWYLFEENGAWSLYLADVDGENESEIEHGIDYWRHAFTPDGRTMIVGLEIWSDCDLYTVEVATGEMVELMSGVDGLGSLVPMDSRRVLFSARDGDAWSLYIARLDGEDTFQVVGPVDGFDGYDISPDGRRIVYAEETPDGTRLYVIDVDGGNQEMLADDGVGPIWSD